MVNPLTHAYFSLKLMEDEELSPEEEAHLLVGSILPDMHLSGLVQYHKTHTKGKEFFESLANHMHKMTAMGIIFHAEKPFGIDHYTHKYDGFITENTPEVKKIATKYKDAIGTVDALDAHFLIEFTIDQILAKENPHIIPKMTKAFSNRRVKKAIAAFASFHELTEKRNKKLVKIFTSKQLIKFFQNFSTPEGTAKNWLSAKFYRELKDERALPFKEKAKRLAKFSYFNIKRKVNDEKIKKLFLELEKLIEPKAKAFLLRVEKKVKPIKNEYWTIIQAQKS